MGRPSAETVLAIECFRRPRGRRMLLHMSLTTVFYDRIMAGTEAACLAEWRRELLSNTKGRVLEVGAGTGANLPHYPDAVEHVQLAEPDPGMRAQLARKARRTSGFRLEVVDHTMEELPYDDDAFDAVVCTLVLCSVADPARALAEVKRVLVPGGAFVFIEHVAAEEGTDRRRWQDRIEPAWVWFTDSCHITRTTEASIVAAGLSIEQIERQSMRKALPWVRPTIRGVARNPPL